MSTIENPLSLMFRFGQPISGHSLKNFQGSWRE